jgi:hypothetical protein
VFVLAWFWDRPGVRRFGKGSGISRAAAYRCLHEGIDVIAATAPRPKEALGKAIELALAYLILDGEVAARRPVHREDQQQEGAETGRWSLGKAHHHGGNVQALSAPPGVPLRVSDVLPGSAHGITVARHQVAPALPDWPAGAGPTCRRYQAAPRMPRSDPAAVAARRFTATG